MPAPPISQYAAPSDPGARPAAPATAAARLQHKRIARAIGALAGFTSALSILIGLLAVRASPTGWSRVAVALHLAKQPLIVRIAPSIAALAMIVAALAGTASFYSWCRERPEE
jgi:hypothetical protein